MLKLTTANFKWQEPQTMETKKENLACRHLTSLCDLPATLKEHVWWRCPSSCENYRSGGGCEKACGAEGSLWRKPYLFQNRRPPWAFLPAELQGEVDISWAEMLNGLWETTNKLQLHLLNKQLFKMHSSHIVTMFRYANMSTFVNRFIKFSGFQGS